MGLGLVAASLTTSSETSVPYRLLVPTRTLEHTFE
jgi:hypothetical protein